MTDNLRRTNKGSALRLAIMCLDIVLVISIIGEMFFFPSWSNLAGCFMVMIVFYIYRSFFLKKKVVLEHPFSFLAFSSMFLACFIALPATLLEEKPITYGFQNPFETFFYQTLMFIVASMAFYAVAYRKTKGNNVIQRTLYRLNFFEADATTLWFLGFIGLLARVQNLAVAGEVEYGDAGNKFLEGLLYLQYTPIIMLFPTLSGLSINKRRTNLVWLYASFTFVLSFATNSRQQMIYPIFTIILLFVLYVLKENISVFKLISPLKIASILFVVIFGLGFLSDMSLAMLANRNIRGDVSRSELFDSTIETLQDDELMEKLRNTSLEKQGSVQRYSKGWDETYLSNFMINRYSNLRVVDQTLYYADKIGYGNEKKQNSFFEKTVAIYPLPVLSVLGVSISKEDLEYSPGDMLYKLGSNAHSALGGFRVTSLVGDGLATFGYWCFPIVFVLLFLSFSLMDSFVFFKNNKILFSTLGLINIFGFLGMFRFSVGCIVPLTYVLRGFWQQCFMFWVIVFLVQNIGVKKLFK
jgi:hypothetical protein